MTETSQAASRITVAEILLLPEVIAGEPHLVTGAHNTDRAVRWAHVVAGQGVGELLDGGELVLTTGAGWPTESAALTTLVTELATAGEGGAAAIFFELSDNFNEAPAALISVCATHNLPLVVLHRQVRFVQITQRVHQSILAAQHEALEAQAEVHVMLTELGLNQSPADYIVERLAATLNCPVVLEDSAYRVIACAGIGADPGAALLPWATARGAQPQPKDTDEWVRVPVEARGQRWGMLTALPGPAHPAGRRTVLELGAFALALGRLADNDGEQWIQLSAKRVFATLLEGRYRNDAELRTQLIAAGLPLDHRVSVAITLQGDTEFGGHESLLHATLETAIRRAVAPDGRVLLHSNHTDDRVFALLSFAPEDPRGTSLGAHDIPAFARRLAHELDMLVPATTPVGWRAHLVLGTPGTRLQQLVASLEHVRTGGLTANPGEVGRVAVHQPGRQPLTHLIRALGSNPDLQAFTTEMLAPLLAYDTAHGPGRGADLLRVLRVYTQHPTNRSLAAQQSRLSRSVFYQRIALIEELLGLDLSDGHVITTLTVALLAHEARDSAVQ